MARKQLKGTIKKLSSAKTVAVEVGRVYHHPRYHKRIRSSKTYLAHFDAQRRIATEHQRGQHFEGEVEVGQPVVIGESRPISKSKRWVVVEIEGQPVGWQVEGKKSKVKFEEPRKSSKAKRKKK